MIQSQITIRIGYFWKASQASTPLQASTTLYPRLAHAERITFRDTTSSSTIRIFMALPPLRYENFLRNFEFVIQLRENFVNTGNLFTLRFFLYFPTEVFYFRGSDNAAAAGQRM